MMRIAFLWTLDKIFRLKKTFDIAMQTSDFPAHIWLEHI